MGKPTVIYDGILSDTALVEAVASLRSGNREDVGNERLRILVEPLRSETRKPTSEVDVTDRILDLKSELSALYLTRRGMAAGTLRGGHPQYWCSACGENKVVPDHGEDTCSTCAKRI